MTAGMPFYVSPEQLMKDRADFARKGIARGRSVVVLAYDNGIAFVAENPSRALHKVSEIYDRIAFAAVGKYNEFENLRVAGVRYADLRGYSYDRSDVTARGLANAYAQTLGTVFTQESKPYEVEIVVAEVGPTPAADQVYRLTYDGSVADEHGFVAMGGGAEQIEAGTEGALARGHAPVRGARRSPSTSWAPTLPAGRARDLPPEALEVAVLDRHRPRRTFRRITGHLLERLLSADDPTSDAPDLDEGATARFVTRRPTRRPSARHRRDRRREHARRASDLRHRERVRHHVLDRGPAHPDAGRGRPVPLPQGRRMGPVQQRLPDQRLPALPRRRVAPGVRHRRVRLAAAGRRPRPGGGADHRGPRRRRPAAAARGRRRGRHLRLQEQHRLRGQLLRLPRELPRDPRRASSRRCPTHCSPSSSAARSPAGRESWSRRPRAPRTP